MSDTVDGASEPFLAGKQLSLIVDGKHVLYNINKTFLPFTKSIVVLAQRAEAMSESTGSSAVEDTASPVVIKIYDPRSLDDRTTSTTKRPWTLTAEQRAAQDRARDGFQWDDSVLWEDDDPEPDEIEGNAILAGHWEQNFFHLMIQCYDAERTAYEHLQSLQGTVIPRILGAGHWDVDLATRAFMPPALLFEYIDGISLRDINPELLDPAICVSLVVAVDSFAVLGVCHTDFNDGNVLFTPPEKPQRAVIIDFGCAIVRGNTLSEEDWKETVQFYADSGWIRGNLKKKGVQLPES